VIKALFFDLDGTLLTSKREMSPETKKALEKCKENGIKLFIATARPPLLDKMLSWNDCILSLFDGGSYYNGGCVVIDEKKIYTPISDYIVEKTIEYVCEYNTLNIALQLEAEKHAFRFPLEENAYQSWGVASDEALSLNQIDNLLTIKILVFFSNLIDSVTPISDNLCDSLKSLCYETAQYYLTDKGKCVQIMAKGINKASSIEKIRILSGFDKSEVAVFGDDINDVEMLRDCGVGIAMSNAVDEAKAVATYICDSNDNDGIAKWLEENVL